MQEMEQGVLSLEAGLPEHPDWAQQQHTHHTHPPTAQAGARHPLPTEAVQTMYIDELLTALSSEQTEIVVWWASP